MLWSCRNLALVALAAFANANTVGKKPACCSNKEVIPIVKILSIARASQFCTDILCTKVQTKTTVTKTATSFSKATATTTSVVSVQATTTATTTTTIVDPQTSTNTVTVTPPPVIVTQTGTVTTTTVVTSQSSTTVTVCTGGGVMKRDALPTLAANVERRVDLQGLKNKYPRQLLEEACYCYVGVPTVTHTVTATSTKVLASTSTTTVLSTVTTVGATAVVTITTHVATTVTVPIDVTLAPQTVTSTETQTATQTSTTVAVQTSTVNNSQNYVNVFSGTGCVYNEYSNYFVLSAANFVDAEQQCACKCNQDNTCKSFFIYYSPPSGRFAEEYDCTTDNVAYNGAFTQCGVYFASQGKAYNVAV